MKNRLLSSVGRLGVNADGWYSHNAQYIPQSFLDDLKSQRINGSKQPAGEYMKVASIPQVIIEKWHSEGFDINKKTAKEIVARLKAENLDAFLATEKRI